MARTVAVIIIDDLDGSPDAETVTFGLDGTDYEMDLGEANRARLMGALAPFIGAARRADRGGRGRVKGQPPPARTGRGAVRAWARESGLSVSGRGRISAEVMRQYDAAH